MEQPLRFAFPKTSKKTETDTSILKTTEYAMATVGFHLTDDAGNQSVETLVQFLEKSPIPIIHMSLVPAGSSLLIVQMPYFLYTWLIGSIAMILLSATNTQAEVDYFCK